MLCSLVNLYTMYNGTHTFVFPYDMSCNLVKLDDIYDGSNKYS